MGPDRKERNKNSVFAGSVQPEGNCAWLGDAICTGGNDKQSERLNKMPEQMLSHFCAKFDKGKHVKETCGKFEAHDAEEWKQEDRRRDTVG